MKKFLSIFLLLFIFSFALSNTADAKTLPQAKNAKTTVTKQTASTSIGVTPKLRRDRKALLIYFSGTKNANAISYILIYTTNGKQEGVGGSVKSSEGAATRELLFGTCSASVCRYHQNITNMRLEVTIEQKSGKKIIKKYKVKV